MTQRAIVAAPTDAQATAIRGTTQVRFFEAGSQQFLGGMSASRLQLFDSSFNPVPLRDTQREIRFRFFLAMSGLFPLQPGPLAGPSKCRLRPASGGRRLSWTTEESYFGLFNLKHRQVALSKRWLPPRRALPANFSLYEHRPQWTPAYRCARR